MGRTCRIRHRPSKGFKTCRRRAPGGPRRGAAQSAGRSYAGVQPLAREGGVRRILDGAMIRRHGRARGRLHLSAGGRHDGSTPLLEGMGAESADGDAGDAGDAGACWRCWRLMFGRFRTIRRAGQFGKEAAAAQQGGTSHSIPIALGLSPFSTKPDNRQPPSDSRDRRHHHTRADPATCRSPCPSRCATQARRRRSRLPAPTPSSSQTYVTPARDMRPPRLQPG